MQISEKDSRFWDQIAEKYARQPIADEEAYEIKLQITREYLTPRARVFEFGCGTGSTALRHAPSVAQIDAIDISENMIAIARQKAADARIENVLFSVDSIETYEPEKTAYDAVLGLSILHLVRDRAGILAKANRLLKTGGVLVTSTACLGDHQKWLGMVLPVMRGLGKAPLVQIFDQETLIADHQKAGFEIVHQWHPNREAALFLVARKIANITN